MGAGKRIYTARAEGKPIPAEVLRAFRPEHSATRGPYGRELLARVEVEAPKPEPAPKPATRQRWQKTTEGRYALGSTGYRVTYCGGPTEPRPWIVTRPDGSRLYDASGRAFSDLADAQHAAERAASGGDEPPAPAPKPAPAKDLPGQGLLF